ncbi:ASCH domain-containing protein [Planktothrix agardhii]|uniref:ASCH domain-containing protein n=1 Tax=Planktothrix agardhii TaxID=1160 RepID=UPI000685F5B2|nr:ASCH domain-containing protein [Planktothrix agardhii]
MGKSKLTRAEDKLLMRGFDYATDLNVFDPHYDDTDVLRQLEIDPNLKAVEISKLTKLPSHRIIAAMMRLKTDGKFPVNPPAGIVVDFPDCSKGNIETGEPVATEEPLTVITLWQPWATLLIKGVKIHETRSWYTSHRGKILIHAAKRKINWCEIQLNLLEEIYPDITEWDYPLGAIVGEMELVNCRSMTATEGDYNQKYFIHVNSPLYESDRLTGNWSDGRFAWEMRNPKPLSIPNVKGKQGLWKYSSEEIISFRPKESDKLICSKGNEGSCVSQETEPGTLVTILDSEGLWKIDSFKDGHAKVDLIEGDRKLPKRRRVALHQLRIARSVEPLTISDVVLGEIVETVEPETKYDIPRWLIGRNAAEAKALINLGFWCVGTVDNFEEPEAKKIIKTHGDWSFNHDYGGSFVEARVNGAVFNIDVEDNNEEQDRELVDKAIATIKEAAKRWGEQFGEQLDLLELIPKQPQTNILLEEPPRLIEPDGQLSLFFDNSEEPPDPDDFKTLGEYQQQHEIWAKSHPELTQAMAERIALIEKSKVVLGETFNKGDRVQHKNKELYKEREFEIKEISNEEVICEWENVNGSISYSFKEDEIKTISSSYQFQKGDRIQKTSNPKWIGEIQSISKKGLTVRYSCGFETIHQSDELTLFAKANSDSVLGESFFKVGEKVKSDYNFKGKVFTVKSIYPSGMVGLIGESSQVISLPSHWLNHHVEKIESKAKSIPLEQTEQTTRKRPAKGCGSGHLMVRSANVKRNEAKGKSPDIYYVYCYSYTNQYGKEIKSSISVPRAKIAQVKQMVENKEHYVKIAKFLGKNLPLSY